MTGSQRTSPRCSGSATSSGSRSLFGRASGSATTQSSGKWRKERRPPSRERPDYSKVRAYRVISLLGATSKLVERTAARLIAGHLERRKGRGLHNGQFGCRKRISYVDAVAALTNRTQQAWGEKKVAGALSMDAKSAFSNMSNAHLGRRIDALEVEPDLIRWTGSFMSDRRVKLVLDGEVGEANPVDTGIPQGPPAAPILFAMYLSGIFDEVERIVLGISGLSFVDDIGWCADGKGDEAVAAKLPRAAAASIDWAASGLWPRKNKGGNLPQEEDPAHCDGKGWGQHRPIQQGSNAVAWSVARLPAHAQGPSRHSAERDSTARPTRRADGHLAGQLQKDHDGLHPVSRHVRGGAVVEGRPDSGHHRPGKRDAAPGQPRGASDHGLLPDNQPWGLCRRSQDLDQRQPSWRTSRDVSEYDCSACRGVARLGRSSVPQQRLDKDS